MLDGTIKGYIDQYLKLLERPFTPVMLWNELKADCKVMNRPFLLTKEECKEYVERNPLAIKLPGNIYITRAIFFKDALFSIKLTPIEKQLHVFIPGDRTIPFIDSDTSIYHIDFYYKDVPLRHGKNVFDKAMIDPLFTLYGAEYKDEVILADPACQLNESDAGLELPSHICLTTISLQPLYDDGVLENTDRLLCRVIDWTAGMVEILPQTDSKEDSVLKIDELDLKRQQWFKSIEQNFIKYLQSIGPSDSIYEQLYKLARLTKSDLCTPYCGSLSEMIKQSDALAIVPYGVESRIWLKDQEIPALGVWSLDRKFPVYFDDMLYGVPEYILEAFATEMVKQKNEDYEAVYHKIYPSFVELDKKTKEDFFLLLKKRHDIINEHYNSFADYTVGELRHRALQLFEQANAIIIDIAYHDMDVKTFPSREIIILCQLYAHLEGLLMSFVEDDSYITKMQDVIASSLEGMEVCFDDIKDPLEQSIQNARGKDFTIIK
ncbi:MAG: hypothetical protein K6E51_14095 [Treponema sp.]|nr:hypothetical protein [Treponema sp.]